MKKGAYGGSGPFKPSGDKFGIIREQLKRYHWFYQ